eukprot:gene13837-19758_t
MAFGDYFSGLPSEESIFERDYGCLGIPKQLVVAAEPWTMKRGREDVASRAGSGKRPNAVKVAAAPQSKPTTQDALSYLREVKTRFADNKGVYDTFLEIMKEFKASRPDTSGVIQRVKQLFKGHRSLVLGFNTFLPKGYEIELARVSEDEEEEVIFGVPELSAAREYLSLTLDRVPPPMQALEKQPVEFDQAISYVHKIKIRFSRDEHVYKAFLEILNLYRKSQKSISKVYEEVAALFCHHQDLLDEFTYFLPDTTQPAAAAREKGGAAARLGGNKFPVSSLKGTAASNGDTRTVHKRKAARKAEEGFKAGYGTGSYDKDAHQPELAKEMGLFDRIKATLRNKDAYADLLKCMNLYSQDIVSKQELLLLAGDVLGKFPDLLSELHAFLGKVAVTNLDFSGGPKVSAQLNNQRGVIQRKQLQKDKFLTKPLSEIVANEQERVTPSYVLIPAGYPKLASSGRTKLGNSVLNHTCVSVITGSEDYSFKLMRKNQYEEALFRCEDDRYDFEIVIETNAAALRLLRLIVEATAHMGPDDQANYQLPVGHALLGSVPANAIERLYGDAGAQVVDHLRKNPGLVASVLVDRMELKEAEWKKLREEMTAIWRRIYEINYHKSLDHRSFYFKQAERKGLLPKSMLAEITDASEQRRAHQSQATVQAMLCQARRCDPPVSNTQDLLYDFSDRQVLDDCWTVLRTAISETAGSGPRERMAELYLRIVEPFFGLPKREEELEKLKTELKEKSKRETVRVSAESGSDQEGKESAPDGEAEGSKDKKASKSPKSGDSSSDANKEENGEKEEEEEKHDFESCVPLSPSFAKSAAAGQPANHMLLGNEMMYIFFRYHRHLYDRMLSARRCASQQACVQAQQKSAGQQYRRMPSPLPGSQSGDEEVEAKAKSQAEADRMHDSFMDMAKRVFTGSLEVRLFEDQVRALLGTNSYELFTIDKLVHKL